MQLYKRLGVVVVLGAVIAACGGNAATQAPNATQAAGATQAGGGGGSATEQPAATGGGGGNGGLGGLGGDTTHGTAHLEIGAPLQKSLDLAFAPALSHFGGTDETVLYYVPTTGDEGSLALGWSAGGFSATFTSKDGVVSSAECTTSNLKLDAGSANGEWECPTNTIVLASGAAASNITFKGTFQARS